MHTVYHLYRCRRFGTHNLGPDSHLLITLHHAQWQITDVEIRKFAHGRGIGTHQQALKLLYEGLPLRLAGPSPILAKGQAGDPDEVHMRNQHFVGQTIGMDRITLQPLLFNLQHFQQLLRYTLNHFGGRCRLCRRPEGHPDQRSEYKQDRQDNGLILRGTKHLLGPLLSSHLTTIQTPVRTSEGNGHSTLS